MPGVLRRTSRSVVAPCAVKTSSGMTVSVRGVSSTGCVNFGDETTGAFDTTSIDSTIFCMVMVTTRPLSK